MVYRELPTVSPALDAGFVRVHVPASPELYLAPKIPARLSKLAIEFAPRCRDEALLAVVTRGHVNAPLPSVVLTDRAIEMPHPRARLELDDILDFPEYSRGPFESGSLSTTHGAYPLPPLREPQAHSTYALLRAILLFKRGGARTRFGLEPVAGPLGTLALHTLDHPHIALAPQIHPRRVHLCSSIGDWIDPQSHEQVIAVVDDSTTGRGEWFVALTSERIIVHCAEKFSARYRDVIATFQRKSGHPIVIDTADASNECKLRIATSAIDPIARFLATITDLPAAERDALLAPAEAAPSESQPITALHPDLRVVAIIELVRALRRSGVMPSEIAEDFLGRAQRLQRLLRNGHSGRAGTFVSPLGAADVLAALVSFLGAPAKSAAIGPHQSVHGYYYQSIERYSELGGTIEHESVTTQAMTIRIDEAVGGARFTLDNHLGTLGASAPSVAGDLLARLADASARTLLLRVLYGWVPPAYLLYQRASHEVVARARELAAGVDLSPFTHALS